MIITGGKFKGRKIAAPNEKITRPTLSKVRQGVFNTLFSILGEFESKTFFDVFGGSGIMGIESLSRGFKEVLVFEKNIKAAQLIKKNYELLNLKPNLKIGDSVRLIKTVEQCFDVVYIDPPYDSIVYNEILKEIVKNISSDSVVVVEHSNELDFYPLELIKKKNYGGKLVSFLKLNEESN